MLFHKLNCNIFAYFLKGQGFEVKKNSLLVPFQDSLCNNFSHIDGKFILHSSLHRSLCLCPIFFFCLFPTELLRESGKREGCGGDFKVGEMGEGKKQLILEC